MTTTKTSLTVQIDARVKEEAALRPEPEPEPVSDEDAEEFGRFIEELVASGKIKSTRHEVNEKGEWVIDKVKHPELYDWATDSRLCCQW